MASKSVLHMDRAYAQPHVTSQMFRGVFAYTCDTTIKHEGRGGREGSIRSMKNVAHKL